MTDNHHLSHYCHSVTATIDKNALYNIRFVTLRYQHYTYAPRDSLSMDSVSSAGGNTATWTWGFMLNGSGGAMITSLRLSHSISLHILFVPFFRFEINFALFVLVTVICLAK